MRILRHIAKLEPSYIYTCVSFAACNVLHLVLHVWGQVGLMLTGPYWSGQDKGTDWAARTAPSGYAALCGAGNVERLTHHQSIRASSCELEVCDDTGVDLLVVADTVLLKRPTNSLTAQPQLRPQNGKWWAEVSRPRKRVD